MTYNLTEAYCMYMGSYTKYPIDSSNLPQKITSVDDLENNRTKIVQALTKATGGFPPRDIKWLHHQAQSVTMPSGKVINIRECIMVSANGVWVTYHPDVQ